MSRTSKILVCILLLCALACGCGEKVNPEHVKFKNDVDNFCNSIAELDASINQIDATSDTATTQLLGYLDEVELRFKNFADLDFPAEFDYLENLADEASQYMSVAVEYYHNAFSNGSYNEYTAEYAQENYSRAIKRIKIIITFLKGETPDDTNVIISYEGSAATE